eukprot:TRINITY_DN3723_c1_g1_i1.p1 TRINITY_DN3723_c1_g1~~TRINITY_DN3723_c1_g1_i1.p1  ORF type:complete len:338 (+),score=59.67 TRINITY_DN3723_c1_g1_i1:48-1061(+)
MLSTLTTQKENTNQQEDVDEGDGYLVPATGIPMEIGCTGIPAKMTVAGMRLFGSAGLMVGKMYIKKMLQGVSNGSTTDMVRNIAQSTLLSGAVEAQAARQVIVRIPIFGESFVERFMKGLGSREMDAVATSHIANTVQSVGLQGKVLVVLASLMVHELVEFSWLIASGTSSLRDFLIKTGQHIASAFGSLSGGLLGTAVGTMAFPGLGTGIGSLAGSIIGASLADLATVSLLEEAQNGAPTGCVELLLEPSLPSDSPTDPKTIKIECPDLDPSGLEHLIEKDGENEIVVVSKTEKDNGFLVVGNGGGTHSSDTDEEEDDGGNNIDDSDEDIEDRMYV